MTLADDLAQELEAMRQKGTLKNFHTLTSPMDHQVAMAGMGKVLVLSSNNYLGLSNHPDVIQAGKKALEHYGAGTASVRFICGTFLPHHQLEAALAKLHRTESALSYVSCWAANTGLIPAITGEGDVLISDALNHASLIDACRMSKARRLVYQHADMKDLQQKLEDAKGTRRIIVLTDGVFSMEGDLAPLPDIVTLCQKYQATLLVDDSHGVGVMGKHGRGTAEHFGLEGEIDIITGTLGKALGGGAGGYVAAARPVIDYLQQVSRPQLFSNALPVTIAASALQAIHILEKEPGRVTRLHQLTHRLREGLKSIGLKPLEGASAIIPIIVGETSRAIQMSQALLKEGIFITGFGYPVVPEGTARLRVQVSAALTEEDIQLALGAFEKIKSC